MAILGGDTWSTSLSSFAERRSQAIRKYHPQLPTATPCAESALARPEILGPVYTIVDRTVGIDYVANPGFTQLAVEDVGSVSRAAHPEGNCRIRSIDPGGQIFRSAGIAVAGIEHTLEGRTAIRAGVIEKAVAGHVLAVRLCQLCQWIVGDRGGAAGGSALFVQEIDHLGSIRRLRRCSRRFRLLLAQQPQQHRVGRAGIFRMILEAGALEPLCQIRLPVGRVRFDGS